MEARIVIIIASLCREIIDNLDELVNFGVAQMPKAYKDATELAGVPDNVLEEAPPIFSKVVKDQVDLIICELFLPKESFTAVKIQSFGQQMIAGTGLRGDFLWQKDRPHGGK